MNLYVRGEEESKTTMVRMQRKQGWKEDYVSQELGGGSQGTRRNRKVGVGGQTGGAREASWPCQHFFG